MGNSTGAAKTKDQSSQKPAGRSDQIVQPHMGGDLSRFYVQQSDYEIGDVLGNGGYGSVESARHKRTGALVAVKRLFPNRDDTSQRIAYQREVEALGTLRHPAILSLHGCTPFDEPRGPLIIMPLMPASVQYYIDQDKLCCAPAEWTPTRKHIVLLGIASAMHFMHENHLIHRDLKPANVLLDDALEPRITDFGLSKFVPHGQTFNQSMHNGTPWFMAPEIFRDEPYDFTVDVYAFGILLFVVLTAIDPFPAVSPYLIATHVIDGDRPTIPPHVSKYSAQLMQRCWDSNPCVRPNFAEIVTELGKEYFLEGLDVRAITDYQARVCPPELIHELKREVASPPLPVVRHDPMVELQRMADSGDARSQVQFGDHLEKGDGIDKNAAEAVRYYRLAADQDDGNGIIALGRCLRAGIGGVVDKESAVALFRKAADRNLADGQYWLACCLRWGQGCNKHNAQATHLFKLAADAGHGRAATKFGEACEFGIGIAKNIEEAVRYYQISSDVACPEGMFNLGDMHHHGRRIAQDIPEAIRLYKLAAQNDIEEAFFALCEIFRDGEGNVESDLDEAIKAAKLSADRDYFGGLIQYAQFLKDGIGVACDPAKAAALMAKAHGPQYRSHQNNYALALERGKGCRQRLPEAVQYYRIAADNGNSMAMCNLGHCYSNGRGIARNLVEAANWFKRSADAGCSSGCTSYGRVLRLGYGVAKDFQEAMKYLIQGVESENPYCYYHLAEMFRNGDGVPIDYAEAIRWYRLAAEKELGCALSALGTMYENGSGVERDMSEAAAWYRKAVGMGSMTGAERLAHLYRDGRGVEKDMAEARRLYEQAIEYGSTTARLALEQLQ